MKHKSLKISLRRMKKDVRAISPIVATLLLVLITVAAATAFFVFETQWQKSATNNVGNGTIGDDSKGVVTMAGSTTVSDLMTQMVPAFEQNNTGVKISYTGSGSGAGLLAIEGGSVQIGMISDPANLLVPGTTTAYPNLVYTTIGYDGVSMFVANASLTYHGISALPIATGANAGKQNFDLNQTIADAIYHYTTQAKNAATGPMVADAVESGVDNVMIAPAGAYGYQLGVTSIYHNGDAYASGMEEIFTLTMPTTAMGPSTMNLVFTNSVATTTVAVAITGSTETQTQFIADLNTAGATAHAGWTFSAVAGSSATTVTVTAYGVGATTTVVTGTGAYITATGAGLSAQVETALYNLPSWPTTTLTGFINTWDDLETVWANQPYGGATKFVATGGDTAGQVTFTDSHKTDGLNVNIRSDSSGTQDCFSLKCLGASETSKLSSTWTLTSLASFTESAGSGTPQIIGDNGNPAVITSVMGDNDGIGFATGGMVAATPNSQTFNFDNVAPTYKSVIDSVDGFVAPGYTATTMVTGIPAANGYSAAGAKDYTLWHPLILVTNGAPTGNVASFINFCDTPGNNLVLCHAADYTSPYDNVG
jgi:flagellin-like protein